MAARIRDLDEMYVFVTLADEVIRRLGPERGHLGDSLESAIGLTGPVGESG